MNPNISFHFQFGAGGATVSGGEDAVGAGGPPAPMALDELQLAGSGGGGAPSPMAPEDLQVVAVAVSGGAPPSPLPIEQLTGGFAMTTPAPEPIDALTGGIGSAPVPMIGVMAGPMSSDAPAPVNPELLVNPDLLGRGD